MHSEVWSRRSTRTGSLNGKSTAPTTLTMVASLQCLWSVFLHQISSREDPCVFKCEFFRTPLWGGLRVLRFCRLVQSSTTGYTLPLFKLFSPSTMSLFAFLAIFMTGHQLGSGTCSPPGSTTSSSRRRRLTSSLVGSSLSPFWCLTSGTGATTCHKLKAKQRNERKAKPD